MASGSHETPLQLRIIPCHVGFKSFGSHLELEVLDSSLNWKFSRTSGTETWFLLSFWSKSVLSPQSSFCVVVPGMPWDSLNWYSFCGQDF